MRMRWGKKEVFLHYIKEKPERVLFFLVLLVSLIVRVIYVLKPTAIWWDESIYIGMGKWLFSHGALGYFEPFRPLLLPFIQGIIWRLGLDNLFWGKIIEVVFSLAGLSVIYLIGENLKKGAGTIATALVSFTPFFFGFTNVGLTDIPSVFFILLSLYLLMKKKPFSAGFSASIAFLLRFPHALFALSIFLFFIIESILEKNFSASFKKSLIFCLGFSLLGIPFFISNHLLYDDILFPLKTGAVFVGTDAILQFQYFYYLKHLFLENPLLIFAPLAFVPFFKKPILENIRSHKNTLAVFLIALVYLVYFSQTAHKEVRYAIAFLPFVALLAGIGAFTLNLNRKKIFIGMGVGVIALCLINIYQIKNTRPLQVERKELYEFFSDKTGKAVITSTPMIMSVSDVKLLGVFDTWNNALENYMVYREKIDYTALDTCGLACADGVCKSKIILLSKLKDEGVLLFQRKIGSCELMIYETRK